MSVKNQEKMITRFRTDFGIYIKENPEVVRQIKQELLDMAGLKERELIDPNREIDMGFVKIPIGKLSLFGTNCGKASNKPFSREVIDFLKSRGARMVIALSDNTEPVIHSAAVEISEEDAEKFAKKISKNHGSLRPDPSIIKGWMTFESE